jgi:hypothetical protein
MKQADPTGEVATARNEKVLIRDCISRAPREDAAARPLTSMFLR